MPVEHTVQSALPTAALLYLPSAQSKHADPDTPLVDVPSGHAVQSSEEKEPGSEANPAAQSIHVADVRIELAYLPPTHGSHNERPEPPFVLVPGGQIAHIVLP